MKKVLIRFNDQRLPVDVLEAHLDNGIIIGPDLNGNDFWENILLAYGIEVEYEFTEEL